METKEGRPRRGPIPAASRQHYNVMLDKELAEWGMRQPGGLSALLRRLLKLSRDRQGRQ
jgi:hypothetical protein